nr:Chain C, 10-mer Peptide from Dystroglycan [Homo sapiens]5GGP_D Chain D, 10-mer Peptide from Dystroglycan [Homo sapiens]
ATPTPVTAIG